METQQVTVACPKCKQNAVLTMFRSERGGTDMREFAFTCPGSHDVGDAAFQLWVDAHR